MSNEDTRQNNEGIRQVNLRKETRVYCQVAERKASQNEEGFETEWPVMSSCALSDHMGEGFFIAWEVKTPESVWVCGEGPASRSVLESALRLGRLEGTQSV